MKSTTRLIPSSWDNPPVVLFTEVLVMMELLKLSRQKAEKSEIIGQLRSGRESDSPNPAIKLG
jgi:hypothetical protein